MSRSRASSGRASRPVPKRAESLLDRIEDRLHDALRGFHDVGAPASPAALAASALPEDERAVWTRWDGLELAAGEARLIPLEEQAQLTADALDAGIIRAGDRVIGERGRDIFVLPEDPWEEGAAVVMVEEAGDRSPEASSVAHLVIGWLGEIAILFDDRGDFHDVFDEHTGELQDAVVRKLCRRRLDLDDDAPNPRLRLAELLRRAGELEGARQELVEVLRRAPSFGWAHHEHGRVLAALGERVKAVASFREAASHASEPAVASWCLMWAAWAAQGEQRTKLAAEVLAARPELATQQAAAAEALIERDEFDAAREQIELGLAILPTHLELLRLRGELDVPRAPRVPEPRLGLDEDELMAERLLEAELQAQGDDDDERVDLDALDPDLDDDER